MGFFVDMYVNFADEAAARRFESLYPRIAFKLPSGRSADLRIGASKLTDSDDWQCPVVPWTDERPLFGSGAPREPRDVADVDEAVRIMYRRLIHAPPFRFAIAGVETSDWIDFAELARRARESPDELSRYHGLVLSRESFLALDCPSGFVPAGEGLLQVPYRSSARW